MHLGASSSALRALLCLLLFGASKNADTISNVNTSVYFSILFHFDFEIWHHLKEFNKVKMTHIMV